MRKRHARMQFEEWEYLVRTKLVHPDAMKCVVTPRVFEAWHQLGYSPTRITAELNSRYANRLKRQEQMVELPTDNNSLSVE